MTVMTFLISFSSRNRGDAGRTRSHQSRAAGRVDGRVRLVSQEPEHLEFGAAPDEDQYQRVRSDAAHRRGEPPRAMRSCHHRGRPVTGIEGNNVKRRDVLKTFLVVLAPSPAWAAKPSVATA